MTASIDGDIGLLEESADKFGFGFFVAAAIHAILIFGVVFEWTKLKDQNSSMEVTLVTHFSELEPEDADYLAQANQSASGTLDEAAVPTTDVMQSRMGGNANLQVPPGDQSVRKVEGQQVDTTILTTLSAKELVKDDQEGEEQSEIKPSLSRKAMMARLDAVRQEYAKRPKIGILTSVAAKARVDAEYQVHMQDRIVQVGNNNYPKESLDLEIYGELRIMLTVLPDGTLESTEIRASSGHSILDRAAVDIARLSAPFAAFPKGLAQKYDKILFIRTWKFLPGGQITTNDT